MRRNCFIVETGETYRPAIADICEYYDLGWIITRINVPQQARGRGHARELLKQILEEADATQTTLWLEISPSDGLNYDELEAWYKRHGFRNVGGIYRRRPAQLPGPSAQAGSFQIEIRWPR
jgi:predicted GNAT family N-acyltransferase